MYWKCAKCGINVDEATRICPECLSPKPEGAVPLITTDESPTPEPTPTRGAGFGIRFCARLIDVVVGGVLGLFLGVVTGVVLLVLARSGYVQSDWPEKLKHFSVLGFVVGLIGTWMYHTVAEGIASASLGKLILGLRVVDLSGQPIGVVAAWKRGLAYHWDALFFGLIGYESMKKTARRQRYGDVWARTVVVKVSEFAPSPAISPGRTTLGILAGLFIWSVFFALQVYVKVV
jgi:uncharacterized RDD family membrane protein YckC